MLLPIQYSLKKDIINHQIIAHAKYKGKESKVTKLFNQRFGNDYSEDNLSQFIAGFVDYNKINFDERLLEIQASWSKIEIEYKRRMDLLFGCDYPLQQLTAYLTTNDRCAIASDYFFVTVFSQQTKRIICHELFHFYTYYIFGDQLKAMSEKQHYDIKESLIELLNLEFLDLIEAPESSYPGHELLREFIKRNWEKEKNIFQLFEQVSREYSSLIKT